MKIIKLYFMKTAVSIPNQNFRASRHKLALPTFLPEKRYWQTYMVERQLGLI